MITMVSTPSLFDSSVSVAYDDQSNSVVVTVGNVFRDTFRAKISPGVVSTYYLNKVISMVEDASSWDVSWNLAMAELGGLGDGFGTSTSISRNGLEVAIGAPNGSSYSANADSTMDRAGRVVVFQGRRGIV